MNDTLARALAVLAVVISLAFGVASLSNAPVDLAVTQPKFPGGVVISSAGSTPGVILNAVSTGVPVLQGLTASGTEVWKITSAGVFIGPAHGGTPTP